MPSAKLKCKPGGNMISIIYHALEQELLLLLCSSGPRTRWTICTPSCSWKKGKQQRREKQMRNFSVWIKFCGLKFSQEDFFWLRIAHMFNQQSQGKIETESWPEAEPEPQAEQQSLGIPVPNKSCATLFFFYSQPHAQARSTMCDVRCRMYLYGTFVYLILVPHKVAPKSMTS